MVMQGYEYVGKASYKGVEFIFVMSNVGGGKKTVEKEFINSDLQQVEELGKKQRVYPMDGLVALLGDESDYIQKRDAILESLESKGPGILVHPLHGIIQNAVAKSWVLNESVTSLGIGQLQIDFVISNYGALLVQDKLGPIALVQTNNAVKAAAESQIESVFKSGTKLLGVYASAKGKVAAIGAKFNEATRFASKQADSITDVITAPTDVLANTIGEFNEAIVVLANAPKQLAASIINVFETINGTIATSAAAYEVFKGFFGFGWTDDIELRFNTVANRTKNNNNRILNDSMNGIALSYAYLSAAQKEYKTIEEIDADIATLEDQFSQVLGRPNINLDFLDTLQDARATANDIFAQARLNASSILDVELNLTSARGISFQYYGDDSRASEIAQLNQGNGLILDGTLKILSK